MTEPVDFNEARRKRAMSERRWNLGPYTFKRRATVPPEVLTMYANAGKDGDDADVIQRFEKALLDLTEDTAIVTATGEPISTADAWDVMRKVGDENDVISFDDLTAITQYLVSGVVERPTGEPSGSQDGSQIPATGTASTDGASPAALISIRSTHDEPATPST